MKAIKIAIKGFQEIARDRRGLAFIVGFPIMFVIIFMIAFGSGSFLSGGNIPHEIAVINNDVGVKLAVNNTTKYINYGENFTQVLEDVTEENGTTNLFHLNNVSEDRADDMLKSRSIDALIIIPKNFSSGFVTMVNNSTRTAILSSVGNQSIANSNVASNITASNVVPTLVFDPVSGTYVYVTPTPTPAPSVKIPGANVTLPKAGNATSTLFVKGDSGFTNYITSYSLVTGVLDRYKGEIQSNATASVAPGTGKSLFADYVSTEMVSIPGTQSFSLFDYMVPGLIVFTLLLQVNLTASNLAREAEKGLLDRMKLSRVRSFDLLFGTLITWTFVSVGQVLLLIGLAIALGYNHQGDLSSIGLAVLIGVIAGMASISLALIIAAFTKNEQQAVGLAGMLCVPLGFLAGAFFPLPQQVIGHFAGRSFQLYDVLPWTHAIPALRSVLTYGTGLSGDVVWEMMWLVVLTAILFVLGVVAYSRTLKVGK